MSIAEIIDAVITAWEDYRKAQAKARTYRYNQRIGKGDPDTMKAGKERAEMEAEEARQRIEQLKKSIT